MKDPIIYGSLDLGHSIVIFEVCRDLIHPIMVLLWQAFPMRSQKISVLVGSLRTQCAVFGWWLVLRRLHVICCSSFGVSHLFQDGWLEFQLLGTVARGSRPTGRVYRKSSGGGTLMQRECCCDIAWGCAILGLWDTAWWWRGHGGGTGRCDKGNWVSVAYGARVSAVFGRAPVELAVSDGCVL